MPEKAVENAGLGAIAARKACEAIRRDASIVYAYILDYDDSEAGCIINRLVDEVTNTKGVDYAISLMFSLLLSLRGTGAAMWKRGTVEHPEYGTVGYESIYFMYDNIMLPPHTVAVVGRFSTMFYLIVRDIGL